MPEKSKQVVRNALELVEVTEALRAVLLRYNRSTTGLISRVERGEPMVEAIQGVDGSNVRPEVTEAVEVFEKVRHQLRVAMFALALEQGATLSEVGRALGFSRQLASRLAAEIQDT
jgi:hypothetical protein